MTEPVTLLLVDDEPLILMDLEMAAEDRGFDYVSAPSVERAIELIESDENSIDVAILDYSLLDGTNCLPIARRLDELDIPYIIHSGDLNRCEEGVSVLNAVLVAKPAPSEKVIATAVVEMSSEDGGGPHVAAQ